MTLKPSSLILGGATFAESIYNGSDPPSEEMVDATIARAFEHGITTIDTSPWYYPSEERIGSALHRLTKQGTLSREQLIIMTKCGHFRPVDSSHEYDYSPSKIRESVHKSLSRVETSYLDVVFLHDVQGQADVVGDSHAAGRPAEFIKPENLAKNGLTPDGKLCGPGDEACLAAIATLFEMKDAGLIRNVGISGYPLAVMLRVAVQSLHHLGRPLDVMLSFCQHTIHSFDQSTGKTNLELFAPLLLEQAGVKQLINASPLSMGLLTPRGPPPWHPAPQDLRLAISNVARALPVSIASVALRFGLRSWKDQYVPTIAGWSCPEEVDACMVAKTASDVDDPTLDQVESLAKHLLQAEGGWGGWSWPAVWAP